MRILHRSDDQLVLQHRPWQGPLTALSFFVMSVTFLAGLQASAPIWHWLVGVLGVGLCLVLPFYWIEVVNCRADRSSQTLTVCRRNLFRRRQLQCQVGQIRWVELYGRSYKGRIYYRVLLRLRSGKAVALMSESSWSRQHTGAIARELSEFMNLSLSQNIGGSALLSMFSEWFGEVR